MTISEALGRVRAVIEGAEEEAGRPAGSVTLVAVSKTFPEADVRAAIAAGQLVFGENRVQEALEKAVDALPERQKKAFVLSKYEDLSNKEIARVMKLSVSSVESLLFRAKQNLQKSLLA